MTGPAAVVEDPSSIAISWGLDGGRLEPSGEVGREAAVVEAEISEVV